MNKFTLQHFCLKYIFILRFINYFICVKEKKEAKKAWDKIRNENTKKIYKEKKSKAKKAVAMVKGHAYDDLYARLETKEGEKELYRLARQRDRARKDVQHVRVIKDESGNVMVNSEAVLKRWKEYFEKLMNEEITETLGQRKQKWLMKR